MEACREILSVATQPRASAYKWYDDANQVACTADRCVVPAYVDMLSSGRTTLRRLVALKWLGVAALVSSAMPVVSVSRSSLTRISFAAIKSKRLTIGSRP